MDIGLEGLIDCKVMQLSCMSSLHLEKKLKLKKLDLKGWDVAMTMMMMMMMMIIITIINKSINQ